MNSSSNIQVLWNKSGGDDLTKGKTFQQIYDETPNKHEAFILQDYDLRCIDEGTPGGVHLAGAGILYPKVEEDFNGKISGIYSHAGCAAVEHYIKEQNIVTNDPDSVADEKAKELAKKLNVTYLGRIDAARMKRPLETHIARALYYDGTGHFNASQAKGLPQGFVISRKYISDIDYAKSEIKKAIELAQGKYGFGDKFTQSTPFYLVAVSDDKPGSIKINDLEEELRKAAVNYPSIKIDFIQGITNG